ncbi:MAG TPA: hypothetical protein PK411_11785 [Mesotoga infera]|jgi:predicted branched-subunit amino acid permease|uniref:Uncharacterized protein n=1 Tax=Mesotoga infera TaxID=1236046 RepID=A0A7Z7LGH6_9BACT|nr:hypothetical protein [Mesotoga infera]MBP8661441.1 hypothetical protein [Mesotoga sp.]NLI06477.1 hypothetical protein [Thermotogaceae bacterium]SSC13587.1 conserved protein of unknown function [Mesotoga infera]HNS66473.1 hypothetical protein [Mesotoga infera]HON29357.1 hypothetical protein [Mesotoga infera]
MLVFFDTIIHYLYFIMTAFFAFLLLRNLFKREKRKALVYDIVYSYVIITFILRVIGIK